MARICLTQVRVFFMANRRMFSETITNSDQFLDLPISSQLLYFHLGMRADDDGFVNNAKKIQRMIGCNDDDLKLLLLKNFVIPFENGLCVIKHWKMHNLIQKDRYKPTAYTEEMSKLTLKNNNVYTLDTQCIQEITELEPQVRLGKASLGEDSKNIPRKNALEYTEDFKTFWDRYPKRVGKDDAFKSWKKTNPRLDDVMFALSWQIESEAWQKSEGQYIPNPSTYLNQGRWKDEPVDKGVPF